jgi:adenine-specific DNA-methyltransferase
MQLIYCRKDYDMEKMKMESKQLINENIEKIKELFPVCIKESAGLDGSVKKVIDFDMLKHVLGEAISNGNEFYELTWPGKRRAFNEANKSIKKTLRPCVDKSVNWNTTQNIYIEGDNLEALKLLQESYFGKIKLIYIDPPYNTGNDFVYADDFSLSIEEYRKEVGNIDEVDQKLFKNTDSNGRFHSDWCSMIYSRLLLARNLLSDDGLIFISIDDNEVMNLRKICDEVFGESNYINHFAWVSNITGRQIAGRGAAKTWESVLVYSKNINLANELTIDISFAKKNMPDVYKNFNKDIREDEHGKYAVGDTLYNHNRKFNEETRPNLVYSIFYNPTTEGITVGDIGEKKEGFVELPPHSNGDGVHKYHAWRWSKNKIINESYNLIVLPTSKGYEIYTKIREFNTTLLKDLIMNISNGDAEVQKLFGNKKYFDYPKSVTLLRTFIASIPDDDFYVMDFFSGSATTAHAVMLQNAIDGGNRKFIMVQLPEKCKKSTAAYKDGFESICDIGETRIRLAAEKICSEYHCESDLGFRTFFVDESNMKEVYYSPQEMEQNLLAMLESNIKEDRTDLDLLFGCLLEWGLPLSLPYSSEKIEGFTVHNYNDGDLIACFDENVSESVVKAIAKQQPHRAVFRDSSFANSPSKINVGEIFKLLAPDTSVKVI